MKIANIVTKTKIKISDEFNVVNSMDKIIHGLPTLIIGYDLVVKLYPNFNILKIELEDNIYWTFKRTEKRDKYEEDLLWFIYKVYELFVKDVKYIFVDPIHFDSKKMWKVIRKIYNLISPITFVNGEMLYIYGNNLIFGVDLKLLKYMGFNVIKIKTKIKKFSNVFLDDNKILIEYKKNIDALNNQIKYIPFLYSLVNGENNTASIIHIPRKS